MYAVINPKNAGSVDPISQPEGWILAAERQKIM